MIGVNTAIASVTGGAGQEAGSIGLGFAIPINQARRLATELVDTGQATQAVIGVGVADAQPRGAAMADVQPGIARPDRRASSPATSSSAWTTG